MSQELNIDDVIEVTIKRLGINGEGIGYYNKLACFVVDALPDEVVKVQITEVYPTRVVAKLIDIIISSPDRLTVHYPDYVRCGAYGMQHVTYKRALTMKREILIQSLVRYVKTRLDHNIIAPIIGMENPYGYRNKVSLPVRKISGKNRFGLYIEGSNEFVPVNDTPVQHPEINMILQSLERLMDEMKFDAYIAKDKSGYMKSCVIRRAYHTGEIQISFLLMKPFEKIDVVVNKIVELYPQIVSVYAYYTDNYKEQFFFTKKFDKLFGKDTITEKLNGMTYTLYPEAFFQLNTEMAHIFYENMIKMADLKKEDVVVDAYAGIAPISHYLHDQVEKVYAIEIDEKSVKSAKLSLNRNHIKNVTVLQSDFSKALKNLGIGAIDVMFFDPPRTGLGHQTVKEILKYKPRKLIYGSCNPSTLAKDLDQLMQAYEIKEIIPIDMFPFTPLVESISMLELKDSNKSV